METLELMPARMKITEILKKAILSGEYKSGQELSLVEVSESLGVSRTPVREAFQALAADGLIELRMNKGAIVRNIDEKFIRDHYEMRILLESVAVTKATQNGMETQKLIDMAYSLQTRLDQISPLEYSELNQNIHLSIWSAANNEKLSRFLMSLWNGPSYGTEPNRIDHFKKSTQEHIEMLQYIQKGDSASARDIMEKHISRSMNNMLEAIKNQQNT